MCKVLYLILLVLIYSGPSLLENAHEDEVKSMPGYKEKITFKHYSGYLNISDEKFFHYWFVESQRSPKEDPLLLWLNGGPGCSSILGLMTELGPFTFTGKKNEIINNTNSWNTVANIFFLESPAGVGYSYSTSDNTTADDDSVAEDNFIAIKKFYEKFPKFKDNDFYITGESYGGTYIPTLSLKLLKDKKFSNFKGFAIGNGCLDENVLSNAVLFYAYYHGVLGDQEWQALTKECCKGVPSQKNCNFQGEKLTDKCNVTAKRSKNVMEDPNLNLYNIYDKCKNSTKSRSSRYMFDRLNFMQKAKITRKFDEYLHWMEGAPCTDDTKLETFMNKPSVRKALNIHSKSSKWESCSEELFKTYARKYDSMKKQILELINSGKLRGLLYNGDVDMVCNFLGDEWFTTALNLTLVKGYGIWEYNDQIAGFVTYYKNFTFLTVKGAGHMVPQDKPGPALKMITQFLKGEDY